jgi:hypothetical protein
MAEVINLRQARKARIRSRAEAAAAQNRARHGQSGAARKAQAADAGRAARDLAGKRRDRTDGPD